MTQTVTYQQTGPAARSQAHTLFAQTMGYVAVTAALFALGAWLGRNLTGGVGIVAFIAAFAVLIGMRFAARRSVPPGRTVTPRSVQNKEIFCGHYPWSARGADGEAASGSTLNSRTRRTQLSAVC